MLVGGESGSTGGLFPSASLPFCPENTFFVRKVENASFAIHPVDFIAACTRLQGCQQQTEIIFILPARAVWSKLLQRNFLQLDNMLHLAKTRQNKTK